MRPHISINVKSVPASVAFYEKVFGEKPQKQTVDYAKFDLKSPNLNFALQEGKTISRVSHFGIEVDSPEEVQLWQEKLKAGGVLKAVQKDSTCCFARQDKAWFSDPDGNEWEVFYVYEQLPIQTPLKEASPCCAT